MAAGGPQQQDDKGSYTPIWILVIIFIVGWAIWHFFQNQIKSTFLVVKHWEAKALGLFTNQMDEVIYWTKTATINDLTMKSAEYISTAIGQYLMYPCIILIVLLAIVVFKTNIIMRYTKVYNMDRLMQQEKENWPQIAPVVDLNIIDLDITKGPWAMSANPIQFGKIHQLLDIQLIKDSKAMWRSEGVLKASVDREKAKQVFASQLGPMWRGIEFLPPHIKALFAIFAARGAHEPEIARSYLADLSLAAARGKMEYKRTDEFLKKYADIKAVKRCVERHAYVYTVMASMIEIARLDGVLASADFLWLKPLDRRLWYVLNNIGRQVAVPEIGGVFAHWKAEKEMARPLNVPIVDQAVNAFCLAINNSIYVPDEDENISTDTRENYTPN